MGYCLPPPFRAAFSLEVPLPNLLLALLREKPRDDRSAFLLFKGDLDWGERGGALISSFPNVAVLSLFKDPGTCSLVNI